MWVFQEFVKPDKIRPFKFPDSPFKFPTGTPRLYILPVRTTTLPLSFILCVRGERDYWSPCFCSFKGSNLIWIKKLSCVFCRGFNVCLKEDTILFVCQVCYNTAKCCVLAFLGLSFIFRGRGVRMCAEEDTILFVCQDKDFEGVSASLQNDKKQEKAMQK